MPDETTPTQYEHETREVLGNALTIALTDVVVGRMLLDATLKYLIRTGALPLEGMEEIFYEAALRAEEARPLLPMAAISDAAVAILESDLEHFRKLKSPPAG